MERKGLLSKETISRLDKGDLLRILIVKKGEDSFQMLLKELSVLRNTPPTVLSDIQELFGALKGGNHDYIFIDYFFMEHFFSFSTFSDLGLYDCPIFIYGMTITSGSEVGQGSFIKPKYIHLRLFDNVLDNINERKITAKKENLPLSRGEGIESEVFKIEESFFVKSKYALEKVELNEILCFESERNYITLYAASKKFVVRRTLIELEGILPEYFIRINRSMIVNLEKIKLIKGNRLIIDGLNGFSPLISSKQKSKVLDRIPLF